MNKSHAVIAGTVAMATLLVGGATGLTAHATPTGTGPASKNIFRLYNPNTGEHFYTTNIAENNALMHVGWRYEGIGWVAPGSGTPVYRLYNPNAKGGDHYYTKNAFEEKSLVKVGWKADNAGKPVFYSGSSSTAIPVYVAYNPNALSGAHNYTTSSAEQNNLLKVGWKFGSQAFGAEVKGESIKAPNFKAVGSTLTFNYISEHSTTSYGGYDPIYSTTTGKITQRYFNGLFAWYIVKVGNKSVWVDFSDKVKTGFNGWNLTNETSSDLAPYSQYLYK